MHNICNICITMLTMSGRKGEPFYCLVWCPSHSLPELIFNSLSFELNIHVVPGWNMTTVLLQVSQGRRPCLEIIPEWSPSERDQIICMMKRCWDQEPRKRPQFSGADNERLGKRFRGGEHAKHKHTATFRRPHLANVLSKCLNFLI